METPGKLSNSVLHLQWFNHQPQNPIILDLALFDDLRFQALGPIHFEGQRRQVPSLPGRKVSFQFEPADIARFQSPTARLNNVCINSTAALLQYIWNRPSSTHEGNSARCAIFSTFDLYAIQYNLSHSEIWRRVRDLLYWQKDIWIIPIHRKHPAEHWVLCVVLVNSYELFLFDSFASVSGWKQDINVSHDCLCRCRK